ncbi:unnamed protein product [Acanthoscelides obtectus]|uniref:Uncharacterized protein n=1 Tax=Acanthoscelides obtectus TaxID=200917 RepID=A0A9P0KZ14_ACAOB|nr:unnamed protein product [Acanthoscelides obtectus]CAK1650939.1 hypothetical protein AOBTE_LOCUS16981 [Acanthoscelides obtectus]
MFDRSFLGDFGTLGVLSNFFTPPISFFTPRTSDKSFSGDFETLGVLSRFFTPRISCMLESAIDLLEPETSFSSFPLPVFNTLIKLI